MRQPVQGVKGDAHQPAVGVIEQMKCVCVRMLCGRTKRYGTYKLLGNDDDDNDRNDDDDNEMITCLL